MEGGGRDALDDVRELASLRAVDGIIALEELPHLSNSFQAFSDLGHHDQLRHQAACVHVLDLGDFALRVAVHGLDA
jgi:hypothetical protein